MLTKTEFFDREFFQQQYLRLPASPDLRDVVDFYWQTDYHQAERFSVKTFPRLGSTLLIHLGTDFPLVKGGKQSVIRSNTFYHRIDSVTTTHTPNDQIFGVQLKINALTSGQRKYNNTSTLLSSVLSQRQHRKVKDAKEFSLRTKIVDEILLNILNEKLEHRTSTVGRVLNTFAKNLHLRFKVKDWEDVACCSSKTLERYFMEVCGMSPKQAMNMLRVRQAASDLADDPKSFNLFSYGYYDRSHFNKDLRRFLMS